jgi:SOS-response transcriptional repressor LexA
MESAPIENQKSYYAIIPANVRYDKNLTANAKLLYGEITALCNEKGYCWATNGYFSDLYSTSKVSVSKWISALEQHGYIQTEIERDTETKQILHRYIRIVNEGIKEKLNTPIKEKFKENSTVINNTVNNNDNDKGANSKEICPIPLFNVGTKNDIEPKPQRDLDVTEAMKTYMSNLYSQKTKKPHPPLKKAQYDKVYDSIKSFADENNLQCQDIIELMCAFLNNKAIKSDWNINHFATEGMMLNRFYEALY